MALSPTTIFGTNAFLVDSLPQSPSTSSTGTAFFTGFAERGPSGTAIPVVSLADFQAKFGTGSAAFTPVLYNSVYAGFLEGLSLIYISRVPGLASVTSTVTLKDSAAANSLVITANGAGVWGNSLKVQVTAGVVSGFRIVVLRTISGSDVVQESSPDLTTQADAVNWGLGAKSIRVALSVSSLPPAVVAATAFVGGISDEANSTDDQWTNALTAFIPEIGAGQVAAPGRATPAAWTALLAHAQDNNRVAILDGADTGVVNTLTGAAATLRASGPIARYGALFVPYLQYPGFVSGTQLNIPPSAVVAGLIATSEAAGNTPNKYPAGANGVTSAALNLNNGVGSTGVPWTAADISTLDNAGVNAFKTLPGSRPRLYGFRSLVDPTGTDQKYLQLGGQRLIMAIIQAGNVISENYVYSEIDGFGHLLSAYKGALQGMLQEYFLAGSLYGATSDQAYSVDVGPTVNPVGQIANGVVVANIVIRESNTGEYFRINISKVSLTEGVV